MTSRRLSIRIDPSLEEKLQNESALRHQPESQVVREALEEYFQRHGDPPSCYDLARKAGLIGYVKNGPTDLSTNRKYFEGFGKKS